jgi:hypothetical protein
MWSESLLTISDKKRERKRAFSGGKKRLAEAQLIKSPLRRKRQKRERTDLKQLQP